MKLTRANDRKAPEKGANMTPMIDVTFQLLIFFMCTMKFKTLDGKLGAYLPKDAGPGIAVPVDRIQVRVDVVAEGRRTLSNGAALPERWDGPYAYDRGRVLRYTIGPRAYTTLDAATERLAELHRLDPERDVTIDARAKTVYSDIVPVLDRCILLGYDDVAFAGAR